MSNQKPPWNNATAAKFLREFIPYRNVLRTIEKTLALKVQEHPHEIRAAAATVILLCRENLWPTQQDGSEQRDQIVHLAARQLTQLKHLYEQRARIRPELHASPMFRKLLNSLDQELRILESRMSDPTPTMPPEPPCTWGDFWW